MSNIIIKSTFTLLLILVFSNLFSQDLENRKLKPADSFAKPRFGIDFFVFPGLAYNSAVCGFSYQKPGKMEHTVLCGSFMWFYARLVVNFNINYNLNVYYKNGKNYLPIWFGIKNMVRNVDYEEGYFPNTLRPTIGTGFGRKSQISRNFFLRFECIAGVSLNLTNGNTFPSKYFSYSFDKLHPDQNPKVLPAIRICLAFEKIIKSKKE